MNHLLNLEKFEAVFEQHGNLYVNRNGLNVDFTDCVEIRVFIWEQPPTPFVLTLQMEPDEFIREMGIRSWEDVERIDQVVLWDQYLKGKACVYALLDYLHDMAELKFRIDGRKTVIEDGFLGFRHEVATVLADMESFRGYVREHIGQLYALAEKKHARL